jgi:hypothetical protein
MKTSYRPLTHSLLSTIKDDPWMLSGLLIGGVMWLMQMMILAVFYGQLPPEVPLYYSLPTGIEQLAAKAFLWMLPGITLLFLLTSLVIMRMGMTTLKIFHQTLIWLTGLVGFMSLVSLMRIILLIL